MLITKFECGAGIERGVRLASVVQQFDHAAREHGRAGNLAARHKQGHAVAYRGAKARMAVPVTKATAGWSERCPYVKLAASSANRPLVSW